MGERKILYIYRSKKHKEFSIEKVFFQISGYFPSENVFLPFRSSLIGAPLNMIYFFFYRFSYDKSYVFHITGDVYYLAIVLPKKRTIVTFHDCALLIRSKGFKKYIFYLFWYKLPLKCAGHITVISDLVYRQLIKINKASKKKIRIIHNPLNYV